MDAKNALVNFHNPMRYVESTVGNFHNFIDVPRGKSRESLRDRGKIGGYFCLARAVDGWPLLIVQIGSMPEDKMEGRWRLCQEKALRLASHREHLLSRQSSDPDESLQLFPGAIRGNEFILSFSGLPGDGDEAFMLQQSVRLNDLREGVRNRMVEVLKRYPANDYITHAATGVQIDGVWISTS